MSEKRFFINGIMVIDGENIIPSTMWQSEDQQKKYCDELNKLHEENKQLKISLSAFVEKSRRLQTILDKLGYEYIGDLK